MVEAAVALGAGVVAGSVALVGFGADSLIEAAAGVVVLWLMAGQRSASQRAERRAQQLIAGSFTLLAVYVFIEGGRDLIDGRHPAASWVGIGLAVVTLVAMPPLAAAKRKVGNALGSAATTSESRQTLLCAYLSAGLLVGLARQRGARLVVGRPAGGNRHRLRRRARGVGRLARTKLRLLLAARLPLGTAGSGLERQTLVF